MDFTKTVKWIVERFSVVFEGIYEIVNSGDRPLEKTAVVLSPVITPAIPAFNIRAGLMMHLGMTPTEGNIVAASAIMIGYTGVIASTRADARLIKDPANKELQRASKSYRAAWYIYLFSILVIVVVLELTYRGVSWETFARTIVISSITFGFEVATGKLNASRIVERDDKLEKDEREKTALAREDKQRKDELDRSLEIKRREREHEIKMIKLDNDLKLKRTAINKGVPLNSYASDTSGVSGASHTPDKTGVTLNMSLHKDWRINERHLSLNDLMQLEMAEVDDILQMTDAKKRTVQRWKKKNIPAAIKRLA